MRPAVAEYRELIGICFQLRSTFVDRRYGKRIIATAVRDVLFYYHPPISGKVFPDGNLLYILSSDTNQLRRKGWEGSVNERRTANVVMSEG